jgi:bifunctional non-homologous end joining protein LigD
MSSGAVTDLTEPIAMSTPTQVTIDKRQLALSNLDKVLYPATSFTKAQVIEYYAKVAPVLLPHLRGGR